MNKLVGLLRTSLSVRSWRKFSHSIILKFLTPITSGPTSEE